MSLFKDIVDSILLEDVQISKVNDAISKTYEVKINYQTDNNNASGERIIQPVAYGVTSKGNLVIRAFQPFGDTSSATPSWKMFTLSGIKKWKPLYNRTFSKPEGFNPNGDKTMSTVYAVAKFDDSILKNASKQLKPVKSSGPVTKASLMNNLKKNEVNKNNYKSLDNSKNYSDILTKNNNSHMIAGSGPVNKNTDMNNNSIEKNEVNNYQENNILNKDRYANN